MGELAETSTEIVRRPKINFTRLLTEQLAEVDPRLKKTYAQLIITQMVKKADYRFANMIFERVDGKTADRLAGPDGGPVQIEILVNAIASVYGKDDPNVIDVTHRLLHEGE